MFLLIVLICVFFSRKLCKPFGRRRGGVRFSDDFLIKAEVAGVCKQIGRPSSEPMQTRVNDSTHVYLSFPSDTFDESRPALAVPISW